MEVKLLYLVGYTIAWYFTYSLISYYFQKKRLAFKWITVAFYLTVPTSFSVVLLGNYMKGDYQLNSVHIHYLLIIVGFYIFSTIEELRLNSTSNWSLIIHHIVFGLLLSFYLILENFPSSFLWAVAVQFTGVFLSMKALSIEYPKYYYKYRLMLEEADYWCFLVFRVFFQTLIMAYIIYEMNRMGTLNIFAPLACILAMYLNLRWFVRISVRRKRGGKLLLRQMN